VGMKLIWIAKHKPRVELVEMKCDQARIIRREMQTVECSKNFALRRPKSSNRAFRTRIFNWLIHIFRHLPSSLDDYIILYIRAHGCLSVTLTSHDVHILIRNSVTTAATSRHLLTTKQLFRFHTGPFTQNRNYLLYYYF